MNVVYFGDNLAVLQTLESESADLIYIDPPFNTGRVQKYNRVSVNRDTEGTKGFKGLSYSRNKGATSAYNDIFDDFLGFLEPRLLEAQRILKPTGSLYFHIDYREVHYCKILLDSIFGRDNFLNEIIWAYDYGARSKTKWPTKHDNILVYVKDITNYFFDYEAMDRIPYMAPGLVTKEKADLGKTPTDTWWHTIVPTAGKERVGYPTQKPLGILRRIINVSSPVNGTVLDFFAGSGTTGVACLELNRKFILVDNNEQAIQIMRKRFESYEIDWR